MKNKTKIEILLDKGVKIPLPGSVLIGDEVDTARISGDNVTIYPGTKIFGEKTLVMSGVKIGFEGPVTIENSLIGPDTNLKGGFFQDAVFAGNNSFGSGAHVRGGTILEEGAGAAHTVGLKQTLLFPFVTLGSLINFCDCLMAGGTSRKDHSEVGSSFIHFNYTPNQDKATPSMFGNVHQGVMLNNSPVFLGGQGGVVGPCRLAFGSVTAAGTICRKDESRADRLILGGAFKDCSISKKKNIYTVVKRVYLNNCRYIAGLIALMNWYRYVRPFFLTDSLSEKLHIGMKNNLHNLIDERINRLGGFCSNLVKSREIILSQSRGKKTDLILCHDLIIEKWPGVKEGFIKESKIDNSPDIPDQFLKAIEKAIIDHGKEYTKVIKDLDPAASFLGSIWLENIEKRINQASEIQENKGVGIK